MLVISRFEDEDVVIRDTDTGEVVGVIKIVKCKRDRVRIGLEFGRKYEINRAERDQATAA